MSVNQLEKNPSAVTYYDESYFAQQKRVGIINARVLKPIFQPHIRTSDKVVDFGCGGGFLLANLQATERVGVEINPTAREAAETKGLTVYAQTNDIPDAWADVIVSNSVLEHVTHPLDEIKLLHSKLKLGGKVVFRLPHEVYAPYHPADLNKHLYTWSPMCAGNLFTLAGFKVLRVTSSRIVYPPFYIQLSKLLGLRGMQAIGWVYSQLLHGLYVRLVWKYPVQAKHIVVVAEKSR